VGKPQGDRPLESLRCRLDDIKTDPRGIGWGGENWIALSQDREQ
jgi:hypothetical protein